ncbi:hypothetical protein ACFQV8_25335 [Pseudonocardia benzenivorans]
MGKLDGKVALITGAGRGQGRSHALTLAREGADIIAVDVPGSVESIEYELSGSDDLAETVKGSRNSTAASSPSRATRGRRRHWTGPSPPACPSSARSTSWWPTTAC